jgi:hypothetical protein
VRDEDVVHLECPGVAPVVEVLGWEIDQGAVTSTRTLPGVSAFAAIANAWLIRI